MILNSDSGFTRQFVCLRFGRSLSSTAKDPLCLKHNKMDMNFIIFVVYQTYSLLRCFNMLCSMFAQQPLYLIQYWADGHQL